MDGATVAETTVYGGTLVQWAVAFGVALAVKLVAAVAKPLLIRRFGALAGRTRTSVDDAILEALKATRILLLGLFAFCLAAQNMELTPAADKIFKGLTTITLFLQAGLWANAILKFFVNRGRERSLATNAAAATSLSAMGFIGRIVLWSLVVLLALDNLGINITTLIAGLGIGGVAVALAVQNILGDLFASLSIVIDKPFVIGDFIIVDDYMGSVEYIGLKTTRIRSLSGEQIIFSNSDLLKARVRNYKRMYERRVVFKFGVLYSTPPDVIEKIPSLVKRIIEGHQKVRFERAHFFGFGESSLDFEVVFWVTDPDYNIYMDIQQAVNLQLMRELAALEVEFAYPTRTLIVEGPVRLEGAGAGNGAEPHRPRAQGKATPPPVNPS